MKYNERASAVAPVRRNHCASTLPFSARMSRPNIRAAHFSHLVDVGRPKDFSWLVGLASGVAVGATVGVCLGLGSLARQVFLGLLYGAVGGGAGVLTVLVFDRD